MNVHVPQPGDHVCAARVDLLHACRHSNGVAGPDRKDASSDNDDRAIGLDRARADVDHRGMGQGEGRRGGHAHRRLRGKDAYRACVWHSLMGRERDIVSGRLPSSASLVGPGGAMRVLCFKTTIGTADNADDGRHEPPES